MTEEQDHLEQQLADGVVDGRVTAEDADAVRTFAQFLHEIGPPIKPGDPVTPERRVATARWLPYMVGDADGPVDDPQLQQAALGKVRRRHG